MGTAVTLEDIRAARAVTSTVARHTPIITSVALSQQAGGEVVLKAESLQRTGAFKIRGAMNKLSSLGTRAGRGVTAGSAGNHAQAMAFAAGQFGVPCDIFVPAGAPITKIEACRGYAPQTCLSSPVLRAKRTSSERWLSPSFSMMRAR